MFVTQYQSHHGHADNTRDYERTLLQNDNI